MEPNNLNNMPPVQNAPQPAVPPAPQPSMTQNPQPNLSQAPAAAPVKPASHGGLWAGVILIVVVLAAGAYFWSERAGDTAPVDEGNAALDAINLQSSSDATSDIEADLNSTDIDNVDYDLNPDNFNAS